ncbi:MAG: ACT domain-containing protein [Lentisphaerae bacterium]|jgi:hypothetical protein|nr:ACT domain-containing protein [Lentisphaerota bacterium]
MAIKQVSIFLENMVGRLATVSQLLGDAGINIRGLAVADTNDFGILRLLIDDVEAGVEVLMKNGIVCQYSEVCAVEIEPCPGSLAKALGVLRDAGVNVNYMYTVAEPGGPNAVMIFQFGDALDKAEEILANAGFKVLDKLA